LHKSSFLPTSKQSPSLKQCFFYWQILAKFQPEKYYFDDLHKGFFIKKKENPNLPDFEEFFFKSSGFLMISSSR
jgi:hypothetical protein